jgi:hypothetical protein
MMTSGGKKEKGKRKKEKVDTIWSFLFTDVTWNSGNESLATS